MMSRERCAISLGGSLLVPEQEVRTEYARMFSVLIDEHTDKNQFGIVTGGGGVCRTYQNGMRKLGITSPEALDDVGIATTHVNAKTLFYILKEKGVRVQYLLNIYEKANDRSDAWITGGSVVGQTSDAALIDFSQQLHAEKIINATNTSYVYEMDHGKIDKTRPIKEMSWNDYLSLIGDPGHKPGENLPFGYTASVKARDLGLSVVILNGNELQNIVSVLQEKPFNGTLIRP
jgi:predicted uridylate kinase